MEQAQNPNEKEKLGGILERMKGNLNMLKAAVGLMIATGMVEAPVNASPDPRPITSGIGGEMVKPENSKRNGGGEDDYYFADYGIDYSDPKSIEALSLRVVEEAIEAFKSKLAGDLISPEQAKEFNEKILPLLPTGSYDTYSPFDEHSDMGHPSFPTNKLSPEERKAGGEIGKGLK